MKIESEMGFGFQPLHEVDVIEELDIPVEVGVPEPAARRSHHLTLPKIIRQNLIGDPIERLRIEHELANPPKPGEPELSPGVSGVVEFLTNGGRMPASPTKRDLREAFAILDSMEDQPSQWQTRFIELQAPLHERAKTLAKLDFFLEKQASS